MKPLYRASLAAVTAVGGVLLLVHLFPEKKRLRRMYRDPELRSTASLPVETMQEVVFERRQ